MKFIDVDELILVLMSKQTEMISSNELEKIINEYGDDYFKGYGTGDPWEKTKESEKMQEFRKIIKRERTNPKEFKGGNL